jgi:hypothetical protein
MDNKANLDSILNYLSFFETLKFVYEFNGEHPMEEEFDSFDWQFLHCNDKDLMEFDWETRVFASTVNEFMESLTKKGDKRENLDTELKFETARLKTDALCKRIECRQSKFKDESKLEDNNGQVFCYANNEGIEAFYRVYYTERERFEDVRVHDELLKDYSAELISIDVKWLKDILLKLQATLYSYLKVKGGITTYSSKELKQKEIPTNFVSPKFQPNVVKELYRLFALKGWVKNDKTTKDSFLIAFSTKKRNAPTSKVVWIGNLNLLKALIRVGLGMFDNVFKQRTLKSTIWDTGEKIFEHEGPSLSKTRSDAKHAVGDAFAPMEQAIKSALACLDSDANKKV